MERSSQQGSLKGGEASNEDDEVDNCDTLWDEDIEPATVGDNAMVGIWIE